MSTPESRPRPQYGEYATPEEQLRARGLPSAPLPAGEGPPAPAGEASDRRPRRRDRFLTYGLLGYGIISAVISGTSYLNVVPMMNHTMGILGIEGQFTNFAEGRTWGTIAAVVLVLGWTLTAVLSMRRVRAGRLSWWVPLVGGVLITVITSFCLAVPMMNDPAFIDFLQSATAGR